MVKALRSKSKKEKQGFTLVEVAVATFISVLVVTTSFLVIQHSIQVIRSAENRENAVHETRTAMEYLRTLSFDDTKLNVGSHSMTLNGLDFSYDVTLFLSNASLKQIEVTVNWMSLSSGQIRPMKFTSMISNVLHG